ncbi:AAA family ATPase [Candidatus Thorarchaeota archaeon]|nr:MAG: AAA family ATPase [Candidatus Thorarchaeota archaeon]
MTKRKDSSIEIQTSPKESSKKSTKKRSIEVPSAKSVVLRDMGYPFRIKGDPRSAGLEIDSEELFADYAREQWMGTIVRQGLYLFDRYIMPDYAFQVLEVEPKESIISKDTKIHLESQSTVTESVSTRLITLDEVVGHDPIKRKCKLILEYLQNPSIFGEWAPRAVLFYGPPGTGKTMTAQAVANQANAKIFFAKASDLIGVHVGDGGRRISTLFDEARKNAPSIIFIDELDAIGLTRSFQSIRGDVSEVVTALLGELDHTAGTAGVVVIGATNALPLIDPAIKNRFDTVFEFALPSTEERLSILQNYSKRLPLEMEIDLQEVAKMTEGLSGRDLRDRILKESLHIAISDESSIITSEIVRGILDKIKPKSGPNYTI